MSVVRNIRGWGKGRVKKNKKKPQNHSLWILLNYFIKKKKKLTGVFFFFIEISQKFKIVFKLNKNKKKHWLRKTNFHWTLEKSKSKKTCKNEIFLILFLIKAIWWSLSFYFHLHLNAYINNRQGEHAILICWEWR